VPPRWKLTSFVARCAGWCKDGDYFGSLEALARPVDPKGAIGLEPTSEVMPSMLAVLLGAAVLQRRTIRRAKPGLPADTQWFHH
jgi:hypothetical protein